MAERNLVAAAPLRLRVQVAAPHLGAQEAGVLRRVVSRDAQHVGLKNLKRQFEPRGILLEMRTPGRRIARVHGEEKQLKIHCMLQILHEQGKQHGVLAARNAHRDLIPRPHHIVFLYRVHKRLAERAHKLALQRAPDVARGHAPPFLCWKW